MFDERQNKLLAEKLDKGNVKTRTQANRTFSYIEAWQAVAECNTVFGFDSWSQETVDVRLVSERETTIGKRNGGDGYPGWAVSYVCKVRVTVSAGGDLVMREGVGAGHGVDRDLGLAHESAVKEAESDAFKRAVKSFGWRFGLALYDKDQEHVANKPSDNAAAMITQIAGMTTLQALKRWGSEYQEEINALSDEDFNTVTSTYKTKEAALKPKAPAR